MAARFLGERMKMRAQRDISIRNGWRSMAMASKEDESPSSWFQKIKSMFVKSDVPAAPKVTGPQQSPLKQEQAEQPAAPLQSMAAKVVQTVKAAISGPYTMESFADEMKNARRAESLAKYMKGMPKNREHVVLSVLERQETMLRTLAMYKTEQFEAQQKEEVASKCGGTILEVEEVLAKYAWAKEAHDRVEKLRKEGKPLPKNLQEVEAMMGGSYKSPAAKNMKVGRNDPCPCGSGKKYKRCCATAYS